jgi:regulator of nucleoside diphosphate kinase
MSQESVTRLEALVEGASVKAPELAERLLEELARARILPAASLPVDVAAIGCSVAWQDETTGRVQTAKLVWPEDAVINAGRASVLTPIGVALLGLTVGASLPWETRNRETRKLTVLSGDHPASSATTEGAQS